MTSEECAEAQIKPEPSVRAANEVQHGQAGLGLGAPQTTTELLQKDESAFGRTQEENGVDLRHVDAFVEQIDAEHHVYFPVPQIS